MLNKFLLDILNNNDNSKNDLRKELLNLSNSYCLNHISTHLNKLYKNDIINYDQWYDSTLIIDIMIFNSLEKDL